MDMSTVAASSLPKKESLNLIGVQWLRGFCAFMVVVFHATQQLSVHGFVDSEDYIFHLGTRGVDLFFVISGFIISYVHYSDVGRSNYLPVYGMKRIGRVIPLYWTILVPVIAVKVFVPGLGSADDRSFEYIAKSIFLIPQEHLPILGAAWTLSFELFFYGVFALAVLDRRLGVGLGLIVVIGCLLAPFIGLYYKLPFFAQFFFSPFIFEFSFGVLTAWLFLKWNKEISLKAVAFIALPAIVLYIISMITESPTAEHEGFCTVQRAAIWGGIGALVTYWLCVYGDRINSKKYWWTKPAEHIGSATYSIYLTNYPVLVIWSLMWKRYGPDNPYLCGIGGVLASMFVGMLIYYFIEAPQQKIVSKIIKNLTPRFLQRSPAKPAMECVAK